MGTRTLLNIVLAGTVMLASAACGTNPHTQANAVMDRAVERFVTMETTLSETLEAADALNVPACPRSAVLYDAAELQMTGQRRQRLYATSAEYRAKVRECAGADSPTQNRHNALRRVRDRFTEESVAQMMNVMRARIAAIDSEALSRVLEGTTNDDEAWIGLVTISGLGPREVVVPDIGGVDQELVAEGELLIEGIEARRQIVTEIAERRAEWYAILGVEDPDLTP